MDKIFEKISSYNVMTNLLPGIVFKEFIPLNFSQNSLMENIFLWYFLGMIISRFGSVIIEPICKKVKFVMYSDYKAFKIASLKEGKIEILLETNNMYRSFFALFVLIIIIKAYIVVGICIPFLLESRDVILIFLLTILFAYSYKKQTSYIKSSVEYHAGEKAKSTEDF